MFVPRKVFRKRFLPSDINIEILGKVWAANPEYERLVEVEWRKKLADTQNAIWDGTYYRITNIAELEQAESKTFRLGTISYRFIATYRSLHEQHVRFNLEPLFHLSTASLIRTSDGYYLFGQRTRNGMIDLIGGGVQRDELEVSSGADIEQNFYKEICEEVGIRKNDIENLTGIGALLSETSNVLIIGHAHTRLSKAEVGTRFTQREDDEMSDCVFVAEHDLRTHLGQMADCRALIPELL